jgi:hypothetical protein
MTFEVKTDLMSGALYVADVTNPTRPLTAARDITTPTLASNVARMMNGQTLLLCSWCGARAATRMQVDRATGADSLFCPNCAVGGA